MSSSSLSSWSTFSFLPLSKDRGPGDGEEGTEGRGTSTPKKRESCLSGLPGFLGGVWQSPPQRLPEASWRGPS